MIRRFEFSKINSLRTLRQGYGLIVVLAFVSMLFAQKTYASDAPAVIAWNPSNANVAGYKVHYGRSSGKYTSHLNAGNKTSYTLKNLPSPPYYIAVTAYDSSGDQSGYSPELVIYSLTATAGTGGSISPTRSFFQSQGADQQFTISPAVGRQVAAVHVDGVSVGAVISYTFHTISANHRISATFSVSRYAITTSAGPDGSISPANATVNYGASQTFTIKPQKGYHVASVEVDGVEMGAITSYSFRKVSANHTISATFAINTYTINALVGANGSISPDSSTVDYGGSQSFTITPDTGYRVSSVKIDGANKGALTAYTFANVTANHTISAVFAVDALAKVTSARSSGAMSPVGVAAKSAATQTSAITLQPVADAGPDQTVPEAALVTLDGSNSSSAGSQGMASYQWTQIGGPQVILSNPSGVETTFEAPNKTTCLIFNSR